MAEETVTMQLSAWNQYDWNAAVPLFEFRNYNDNYLSDLNQLSTNGCPVMHGPNPGQDVQQLLMRNEFTLSAKIEETAGQLDINYFCVNTEFDPDKEADRVAKDMTTESFTLSAIEQDRDILIWDEISSNVKVQYVGGDCAAPAMLWNIRVQDRLTSAWINPYVSIFTGVKERNSPDSGSYDPDIPYSDGADASIILRIMSLWQPYWGSDNAPKDAQGDEIWAEEGNWVVLCLADVGFNYTARLGYYDAYEDEHGNYYLQTPYGDKVPVSYNSGYPYANYGATAYNVPVLFRYYGELHRLKKLTRSFSFLSHGSLKDAFIERGYSQEMARMTEDIIGGPFYDLMNSITIKIKAVDNELVY